MFPNQKPDLPVAKLQPDGVLFYIDIQDDQIHQAEYYTSNTDNIKCFYYFLRGYKHTAYLAMGWDMSRFNSRLFQDIIFLTYKEAIKGWKKYIIARARELQNILNEPTGLLHPDYLKYSETKLEYYQKLIALF